MTQAVMTVDITAQNVDLTNCDREPIHIPGTVQSHGVLLVCIGHEQRVAHASENLQLMLSDAPEYVLGKPLTEVIGPTTAAELKATLETTQGSIKARIFNLELDNGKRCHASIINHMGRILIELEPAANFDADAARPVELVGALLSQMQQIGSVERLCNIATERMRTLIQYDRVMIYRFLHNGSGHVITESKRADLSAFLGLHYPASDIPQQARALYLKNWIRLIADVSTQPVPIIPERDASGQAVDLSFAALRSVSPIHIEYLKNMGVAASMSISIIVGGKLWGLIACHNYTAKIVPADIRAASELFGQILSLQIESLEPSDRADLVRIARVRIDKMLSEFPTAGSLLENLTQRLSDLRTLIPCDGAGLWIDGIWKCQGTAPPDREIPALARFVIESSGADVFATHELANRLPTAASYTQQASGLLAIPLSRTARDYLMLFRQEIVHTVKWAGDPNKPVTVGPRGDRLTPRKSFETWESDVRGQSLPWEQSDRLTAEALRISLLEVVLRLTEVAARERAATANRPRLLIAELNHRVKNILGLINALVTQGRGIDETLTTFVTGLQGRIRALAFAHDQAAQDGAGGIRQLFENETSPYRGKQLGAIVCNGPPVAIDAHAFSVLALVVHEMTTNAAKYGALSVPNAHLTVAWRLDESGNCVIEWQESGGPAVQSPSRFGFGTTLIDRQIEFELNGETDVHYELTGLRARFVIPAKHVVENGAPMALAATRAPELPSVTATLRSRHPARRR
jgi:light-regulated signal transduction histidine kinase (bacteriophytochrome)